MAAIGLVARSAAAVGLADCGCCLLLLLLLALRALFSSAFSWATTAGSRPLEYTAYTVPNSEIHEPNPVTSR